MVLGGLLFGSSFDVQLWIAKLLAVKYFYIGIMNNKNLIRQSSRIMLAPCYLRAFSPLSA